MYSSMSPDLLWFDSMHAALSVAPAATVRYRSRVASCGYDVNPLMMGSICQ